jgi:hypothetical protein
LTTEPWWQHRRRRFVRSRLRLPLGIGAIAIAITMCLPWINATEEALPYTVSGWETRLAFGVLMGVIAILLLALATFGDLLAALRWAPAGLAAASLAMTGWIVHHNEYYESPDLAYGFYASAAVQAVVLAVGVALALRQA